MSLRKKTIKGKEYYYSELGYSILGKTKKFSKYIGLKKPTIKQLKEIDENFRKEVIERLSNKKYSCKYLSKDEVIKTLLYKDAFNKKFNSLSPTKKKKFEVDRTIIFTLTTLTTEDVDVSLNDVKEAYKHETNLSLREQISKNMLEAVESIKDGEEISVDYLLKLHSKIMSKFESKSPGKLREKQVYLHKRDEQNPLSIEIAYRPPSHAKLNSLLSDFTSWFRKSDLNPVEKAIIAHFKFYKIHPFLDGNKRICRLLFNRTLLEGGFPLINISENRDDYFDSLINSVEKNKPEILIKFALKEYYKQVKEFVKS